MKTETAYSIIITLIVLALFALLSSYGASISGKQQYFGALGSIVACYFAAGTIMFQMATLEEEVHKKRGETSPFQLSAEITALALGIYIILCSAYFHLIGIWMPPEYVDGVYETCAIIMVPQFVVGIILLKWDKLTTNES